MLHGCESRGTDGLQTWVSDIAAYLLTLQGLQGPWLIGGAFQGPPEELAELRWRGLLDGEIVRLRTLTCTTRPGRELDYFIAQRALLPCVLSTCADAHNILRPHTAAKLCCECGTGSECAGPHQSSLSP
eukprot:2304966-Amphidinium_carterae.3